MTNQEKVKKLAEASAKLGQIGLIIIEDENDKNAIAETREDLSKLGYSEAEDYLKIMEGLEKESSVFYAEREEKIDNLVWEIIREYEGGIISLMDRKNHSGLKTIKYDPRKSQFVIVLLRKQIENGPANFYELIGPMESI